MNEVEIDELFELEDYRILGDSSVISLESLHGDDSMFGTKSPIIIEDHTPSNTNGRIMQSIVTSMTPGSFFAEKSGDLGGLGDTNECRPAWNTPKLDAFGRKINLIDDTPNDRPEKRRIVNFEST